LVKGAASGGVSLAQSVGVEIQRRVSAAQSVSVGGQATAQARVQRAAATGSVNLAQDVEVTITDFVSAEQEVSAGGQAGAPLRRTDVGGGGSVAFSQNVVVSAGPPSDAILEADGSDPILDTNGNYILEAT